MNQFIARIQAGESGTTRDGYGSKIFLIFSILEHTESSLQ